MTKTTKFRHIIILSAIFIIAVFLRTVYLDNFPAGLHFDEAQAGYNAKLIWEEQRNISGQRWPIYIDSFGDYRPAIISYFSALMYSIFGLKNITPRLPTAIFGSLLTIISFLLANNFFKNYKLGLIAATLTATSSYAIISSRGTLEGVIDVFFTLTATLLTFYFVKTGKYFALILIYFCLLAGYFSYMTSRILGVPFIMVTAFLSWLEYRPTKKPFLIALPILCYLIFPWLFFINSPIGKGRFTQTSVFNSVDTQMKIDEAIRSDRDINNPLLTRIIHNKPLYYFFDISQRYLTYFSPNTVLYELKLPTRHNFPNVSPLNFVEFAGIMMAMSTVLFLKKMRPIEIIPLILLVMAPIPAALTVDDFPNFSRIVFFVPLVQIVSLWGWYQFLQKYKQIKNYMILFLVLLTAIQFLFFVHQYFIHGPKSRESIETRATEMEELSKYLYKNMDSKIILSEYNGPYIYYLYYNNLNIFDQKISKSNQYFSGDYKINNLDFVKEKCFGAYELSNYKYDIGIFWDGCPMPKSGRIIDRFYRTDGSVAVYAIDLRNWYEINSKTLETFVPYNTFINSSN